MGDLWISTVESWQKLVLLSMFQTSEVPNNLCQKATHARGAEQIGEFGFFCFSVS